MGVIGMEDKIRLLMEVNAQLSTLLQAEINQNKALTAKIEDLLQRIDELSHKKNSRNSSAPPSSDGYAKQPPRASANPVAQNQADRTDTRAVP